MRKIRKKISLFLIAGMMLGSLAGCGADNRESGNGRETRTESTESTGNSENTESIAEKYRKKEEAKSEDLDSFSKDAVDGVYEESEVLNEATVAASEDSRAVGDYRVYEPEDYEYEYGEYDAREYDYQKENKFLSVTEEPLSTFAADCDTASYSNIRSYIEAGTIPPEGAVRIEEMLNYFQYNYKKQPEDGKKFAIYTEYSDCPWNEDTKLMMVGINTADIDFHEKQPSNLVFLIDTSGSMYAENKLPLAQKAFQMLAENLDENDRVSIVTYAGSDTVVLSGVPGSDTYTITEALNQMEAGGSTNGSDGLITAYSIAEKYFIRDGNNRVILATDGDLNVGLTSESDLVNLVTEEKESGIFLSVLGFGSDNLKDNKLEAMADYGNGNYAYIDSVYEAKKVLVDEMGGNLYTVAKDVKLQIEFNPEYIKGYRQIGYENRALAASDFEDDTVDGGEIGAGHMVTALYEIVPVDSDYEIPQASIKYSSKAETNNYQADVDWSDELATVNIRYKEPDADTSVLETGIVKADAYRDTMSADMSFAAAVASYGMVLKDSQYKGTADYPMVKKLAEAGITTEEKQQSYRSQFLEMVEQTENLLIVECN